MTAETIDGRPGEKIVSARLEIASAPEPIFDLLADPAMHHLLDGSDTVVAGHDSNPERLYLGAKFGMSMRLVVPYRITNKVVEFDENRVIAWRHFGHHVWRYQLDPVGDDKTLVTESFNWGVARFPPMYEWAGYPDKHLVNIATSLERLASVVQK
jgi:hypothetical protein